MRKGEYLYFTGIGLHHRGRWYFDNALYELVDNQPTAFDVENVVSNLEQLKLDGACEYCGYCECLNECWDGDMSEEHAINMAIEIVKRGGLDES